MNHLKVSVIVPNYNHAPYLRQRLDSIYNQTFQDFEVIILDDCSTDNSKEIIEEYRNRPQTSHIVYNEVNSGSPFKQWAKGLNLAQGEFIWIAESDDYCKTIFLAKTVTKLQESESSAFVYSNSILIDPQNQVLDTKDIAENIPNGLINGKQFIFNFMYKENSVWNASAVVFRKKQALQINKDFTLLKAAGDYLFWIKLAELGNVFHLGERLNYFRQHLQKVTPTMTKTGILHTEELIIVTYLASHIKLSLPKMIHTYCSHLWKIQDTSYLTKETEKKILQAWKENNKALYYISLTLISFKRKIDVLLSH